MSSSSHLIVLPISHTGNNYCNCTGFSRVSNPDTRHPRSLSTRSRIATGTHRSFQTVSTITVITSSWKLMHTFWHVSYLWKSTASRSKGFHLVEHHPDSPLLRSPLPHVSLIGLAVRIHCPLLLHCSLQKTVRGPFIGERTAVFTNYLPFFTASRIRLNAFGGCFRAR